MTAWVLIGHLAATWFMCGVIWVVQLVHYPLFKLVGPEHFARYEQAHVFWITWVVAPAMLIEAATGVLLLFLPLPSSSRALLWGNLLLLLVIWLTTAFFSAPAHQQLASGFDATVHQWLVRTNWVRTIAWSLRAIALSVWLVKWVAGGS